jgi:hypothetical protein
VVRRRLPAPRPDVVFETNLSAVVGALSGCARNSRRRDCFSVADKSIRRQLICGALTVVLAVLLQLTKRNALDGLLPEPLAEVLEREAEQRVWVAELLDGIDERATLRTWARLVTRRTQSR